MSRINSRSVRRDPAAVEPLEHRRMLAADWAMRVNFSTEAAPRMRGYRLDYGAAYGRRGNGLTYGWSVDKRDDASYAKSKYDNARGDSHIDLGGGDAWTVNVPNGYYQVRALMGDPATLDGDYRINIDDQPLVKGKPYPGFPFIEGLTSVNVTDGTLTVTNAVRSHNNHLCSINIMAADPPAAVPQGAAIKWTRDDAISAPDGATVESAVVRLGDEVIVLGGFTKQYLSPTRRVNALNTTTGEWRRLADLPDAETHIAAATDGKYVYIAGGQTGPLLSDDLTADVWRLNLATNTWERFGRLPEIRAGAQMQILRNELHLIGGDDASRVVAQSTHYVLDLADPAAGWRTAAPLPVATDHHTSIVVNGDLYVLGGEVDHGTSYFARSDFFRYDAAADAWTTLPNMPSGMSHMEAATLTDGRKIIVIAGQGNVQQMSKVVYSYDLATGQWHAHSDLPTARKGGIAYLAGHTVHYITGDDDKYGEPAWSYAGVIG